MAAHGPALQPIFLPLVDKYLELVTLYVAE